MTTILCPSSNQIFHSSSFLQTPSLSIMLWKLLNIVPGHSISLSVQHLLVMYSRLKNTKKVKNELPSLYIPCIQQWNRNRVSAINTLIQRAKAREDTAQSISHSNCEIPPGAGECSLMRPRFLSWRRVSHSPSSPLPFTKILAGLKSATLLITAVSITPCSVPEVWIAVGASRQLLNE